MHPCPPPSLPCPFHASAGTRLRRHTRTGDQHMYTCVSRGIGVQDSQSCGRLEGKLEGVWLGHSRKHSRRKP
eukprot:42539-Eustigmatos_ZCMA.PRE.1